MFQKIVCEEIYNYKGKDFMERKNWQLYCSQSLGNVRIRWNSGGGGTTTNFKHSYKNTSVTYLFKIQRGTLGKNTAF